MVQIQNWNNSSSKLYARIRGTVGRRGTIGRTMRDSGLEQAIKATGGAASLARGIGIAQPSVSAWSRIPAEGGLAVEAMAQVSREILPTDVYRAAQSPV